MKHTPIITQEEDNLLWENGILGTETQPSQFSIYENPCRYIYVENGFKYNSGVNLKVENKTVPVYRNSGDGSRCLVCLLDT